METFVVIDPIVAAHSNLKMAIVKIAYTRGSLSCEERHYIVLTIGWFEAIARSRHCWVKQGTQISESKDSFFNVVFPDVCKTVVNEELLIRVSVRLKLDLEVDIAILDNRTFQRKVNDALDVPLSMADWHSDAGLNV